MKQQVIAGGMDVASGVGYEVGYALRGQVGADRLVVPQAIRAQAAQPEREAAEYDDEGRATLAPRLGVFCHLTSGSGCKRISGWNRRTYACYLHGSGVTCHCSALVNCVSYHTAFHGATVRKVRM